MTSRVEPQMRKGTSSSRPSRRGRRKGRNTHFRAHRDQTRPGPTHKTRMHPPRSLCAGTQR
eukprot:2621800-Prorocentrum_lima.AAC.1